MARCDRGHSTVAGPDGLQEKGIGDVELALDFFAGAIDGDFDVGIISSEDADLPGRPGFSEGRRR